MKSLLRKILTGSKGVATSLVEATATVAVGAVLAGVAVNGGLDALDSSKVEAAKNDVAIIGQALLNFFKDNSFYPMFRDATRTAPDEEFFVALVSEQGTYPSPDFGDTWRIGAPIYYRPDTRLVGHQASPDHDTIEGHLVVNLVFDGTSRSSYPVRGSSITDHMHGWAGPYISNLPRSDPWGGKYMVNVQELNPRHVRLAHTRSDGTIPRRVVMVLSAGPNGLIETSAEQDFEVFLVRGDDIVARVR